VLLEHVVWTIALGNCVLFAILILTCVVFSTGDEALVSCGIMESLIRVINWLDDDGQDHITVRQHCYIKVLNHYCEFLLAF